MSPCVSMLECHSSEFLEVQISPRVLVMTGIRRCPVSSARSAQKFGGKNNKYFELKNSWGCRPNSNYLLKLSIAGQSSCAPGPRHVSLLVHAVKHAYKHTIPAFTHAGLHRIGTLCKHVCLNVNKV